MDETEVANTVRTLDASGTLSWAQQAFDNLRIVPTGDGIIHQVNLEFLASVVCQETVGDQAFVYPDTVLGMGSHTELEQR